MDPRKQNSEREDEHKGAARERSEEQWLAIEARLSKAGDPGPAELAWHDATRVLDSIAGKLGAKETQTFWRLVTEHAVRAERLINKEDRGERMRLGAVARLLASRGSDHVLQQIHGLINGAEQARDEVLSVVEVARASMRVAVDELDTPTTPGALRSTVDREIGPAIDLVKHCSPLSADLVSDACMADLIAHPPTTHLRTGRRPHDPRKKRERVAAKAERDAVNATLAQLVGSKATAKSSAQMHGRGKAKRSGPASKKLLKRS